MELPNWLRIALLLLSFVSFLPQLRLLYARKDSAGLSLFYLLFNLIVATELFTVSFVLVVNCGNENGKDDLFVHNPPDTGDKINLAQFTLVWVLWLVIFITCLARRSSPDLGRRTTVSVLYLFFLLISVVPLFIDALTDHSRDQSDRDTGIGMFSAVHLVFVIPIVNLLGIAALVVQARAVMGAAPGAGLGALSLLGLAAQGLVFALLALSWPWRLAFLWDQIEREDVLKWAVLKAWFQVCGLVAVDYAVFALGQFVLLLIAVRRGLGRGDIEGVSAGETEPLLRS